MASASTSYRPALVLALAAAVSLAGCGGGGSGGGGSAGDPVVATTTVTSGPARYSRTLSVTLTGTRLDQGLLLSATGCTAPALGTAPPQVSGPTIAYVSCRLVGSGAGELRIARSDGALLATVPFSVPVPQVTLAFDNGAGVSASLVITLAPDKAPRTVDNFLGYVESGFYVGTLIHRVAPGFVVQGGGYIAPLVAAPGVLKAASAPIPLEAGNGLRNLQFSVAMARTAAPDSATSQFFINLVDNSATLDPGPLNGAGYAVFGNVTLGVSGVTSIVNAPCSAIPLFLPSGECTPQPNLAIVSAVQTQ